ncbi:MAG TPA: CoA transferase [Rhodospirillaceae bacterium]|nr:CoA transferase [Candidatus Neomarinimicrobiota bacterium]HCX14519.1 CoA transferase [Rhodospirillaceae bacterium]
MPGPLHGVRILEISNILLGPLAGQLLADMGADVIKIEPPGGDGLRTIGASRNTSNMAALFLNCNRNKRSLVLDLKQKSARDVLLKLAKSADLLIHNYRPQAMQKLGLDYAAIKKVNPGIVYAGAHGYGRKGRYGDKGALDDAIQAASGIAALSIPALDEPRCVPMALADQNSALTLVYGVLGALLHRERTGQGQELEVPMFETMVHYTMLLSLYGKTFEPAIGTTDYPAMTSKSRKPCATKDGFAVVITYVDPHWEIFARKSGHPELIDDPRFKTQNLRVQNMDATYQITAKVVAERTTQEWVEIFKETSVPVTPVNSLDDLVKDPHLNDVGFWKMMQHPTEGLLRMAAFPVNYEKTPTEIRRLAPNLGENSAEILKESGYSDAEIDTLVKSGATVK